MGVGKCITCGVDAGMFRSECRACESRRVETAARAATEAQAKAEGLRQKRDILLLAFGHGDPKGSDWYTCAACGRREYITRGADAKLARIATVFGDCIDAWHLIVKRAWMGFDRSDPSDGLVYASELQVVSGLSPDAATGKLMLAAALGLMVQHGVGYRWGPPLCEQCYGELSERLQRDIEKAERGTNRASEDSGRDPIPAQLRFRVLQRDAFRCGYCGRTAQDGAVLHVDHVIPVALGGLTAEDNLMTACAECNLGKSASPVL